MFKFKKVAATLLASAFIITPTLSSAHPLPPPPAPPHHMHVMHHGHGIGGLSGLLAGTLIYGLVCFFPEKLSEERRKHDARWAKHVDFLPCGWDTILDSPTEASVQPVVQRTYRPRNVCAPPRVMVGGRCTLNK